MQQQIEYLSFHIYGERIDSEDVCLQLLEVTHRIKSFFINYADRLGPHVRLRIRNEGENDIQNYLKRLFHSYNVLPVPYVRELNRYGGQARIQLAESLFEHSSRWVARFLVSAKQKSGTLYPVKLIVTYSLLNHVLNYCIKNGFPIGYRPSDAFDDYLPLIAENNPTVRGVKEIELLFEARKRQIREFLDSQEALEWCQVLHSLLDELYRGYDEYVHKFHSLRDEVSANNTVQAYDDAIVSQIHMHTNRLGIDVLDEQIVYVVAFERFDKSTMPSVPTTT